MDIYYIGIRNVVFLFLCYGGLVLLFLPKYIENFVHFSDYRAWWSVYRRWFLTILNPYNAGSQAILLFCCVYLSKILYRSCDDCSQSYGIFISFYVIMNKNNLFLIETNKSNCTLCFAYCNASLLKNYTYLFSLCSMKMKRLWQWNDEILQYRTIWTCLNNHTNVYIVFNSYSLINALKKSMFGTEFVCCVQNIAQEMFVLN